MAYCPRLLGGVTVIDLIHVLDELKHLVGVADLVIVPADDLDKGIRQGDAGGGVENGGTGVAEEVGGNDGLVGVAEDALQLALAGLLHGNADLIVGGGLLEVDGQVNDGNVQRRNAHGHTGQLAVELGNDLADRTGCAGGAGDDVRGSRAAAAPILERGTVHRLLCGGDRVDGRHQAVLDAEVLMQDLGNGGEAVGGAARVGDELHIAGIVLMVHAHDEHRGVVLARRGHDDLLCAGGDVTGSLFLRQEQAGGLDDILRAELAPLQVRGVSLAEHGNDLTVDDQRVLAAFDVSLAAAVHRIVLEHIGKVIGRAQIVDADHVDLGMLEAGTEHHTADTAKAVDTDFNRHKMRSLSFLRNISNVWHIWYYSILFPECKCFFQKIFLYTKVLVFSTGVWYSINYLTLRSSRCGTFFHTKIAPSCKGYEQLSQRRRTL